MRAPISHGLRRVQLSRAVTLQKSDAAMRSTAYPTRPQGHQAGSFHIRGEVSKMGLFRCENTVKAVVRLRCTDEGKSYTVTIWDDAAVEAFTEVKLDDVLKVRALFRMPLWREILAG